MGLLRFLAAQFSPKQPPVPPDEDVKFQQFLRIEIPDDLLQAEESPLREIEQLHELVKKGAITESEFNTMKWDILARMQARSGKGD